MAASEYVKSHGFKSLKAFAEETGISKRTILDWYSKKPRFLEMVVEGAKVVRNRPDLAKIEEVAPVVVQEKKSIALELYLYIENNSSFVRGKKKVIEGVEQYVLPDYGAKKTKTQHYAITFEYTDKEDLDEQVYELLNEIESEADSRDCFSESSISSKDESVDWCW